MALVFRCRHCKHDDFADGAELAAHQEACGRHACHGGDDIIEACYWCQDRLYTEITGRSVDPNYYAWRAEWMATTTLYAKDRMLTFIYEDASDLESIWASILPPDPEPVRQARDTGFAALVVCAGCEWLAVIWMALMRHEILVPNTVVAICITALAAMHHRTWRRLR